MRKRSSGSLRIVAAASGGFLTGAIAMAAVVWGFPNVMRSPPPSGQHPAPVAKPPILSSTTMPIIKADPLPELRDRQLMLPVRGAVKHELRDSFYETRGATHNHEAIDIMAPRNTPILAVEDGTIARLLESKAGGTTVYQFDPTTSYVITTPISSATLTGSKRAITFNAGRCWATWAPPATRPKLRLTCTSRSSGSRKRSSGGKAVRLTPTKS